MCVSFWTYVATAGVGDPGLMTGTEVVGTIEEVTPGPGLVLALIHQSIQEASQGEGLTLARTRDHQREVDIPLLPFEVQDIEIAQGTYVHVCVCTGVCTIKQYNLRYIHMQCTYVHASDVIVAGLDTHVLRKERIF